MLTSVLSQAVDIGEITNTGIWIYVTNNIPVNIFTNCMNQTFEKIEN